MRDSLQLGLVGAQFVSCRSLASKLTADVFPICPGGGKPTAASHVPLKLTNAHLLPPLSVELTPCARIRPFRSGSSESLQDKAEAEAKVGCAVATFTALRAHPLAKGTLCQDMAIFRTAKAELDVARLVAHQIAIRVASPPAEAHRRLSSNLTEMMRQKAGLRGEGDLDVESAVMARWALPMGGVGGPEDLETLRPPRESTGAPADPTPDGARASIHHAEIRTHSVSPRILPSSIYLSHQVDFHAATATDEFSPLSVLDKVARTKRLVFRPEVEVHHASTSFDEPLTSALHSMMDSRPSPQVPALPNGSPSKAGLWGSIPIRQVAANLGEGVDRVRREYVRAQHKRGTRRPSDLGGTPLSFEDDTVFATADDDASSAPSSGPIPTTDGSVDDEWGDRWEDEYRRAVEDDGGAEDLVLGLLDEEEDERRRWERRQKVLKKEYAKEEG